MVLSVCRCKFGLAAFDGHGLGWTRVRVSQSAREKRDRLVPWMRVESIALVDST